MRFPRGIAHKLPTYRLYEVVTPVDIDQRSGVIRDSAPWAFWYLSGVTLTGNWTGRISLDKQPAAGYRWLLDTLTCVIFPNREYGTDPATINAALSINGIPVVKDSVHLTLATQNDIAATRVTLFQYAASAPYYGGSIIVDAQCDFDVTNASHQSLGLFAQLIVTGTAEPL